MLNPQSYSTIHTYAEAALVTALERGDTSARGLLRGFREHAPGLAPGQFRLGKGVRLFDHLPPPGMEEFAQMFVLRGGIGSAGLYVVHAVFPQDCNGYVIAGFVPALAAGPWDIDTLFRGVISQSQAGRRRLADLERSVRTGHKAEVDGAGLGLMDVHEQNIFQAHLCVGEHADRLRAAANPAAGGGARAGRAAASPHAGSAGLPLLRLGKAGRDPWVAFFPGRGHLVVAGTPEFTARFVTLEGTFDESWPDWVSPDTLFRRSTEKANPGLADRLQQAAFRKLDAECGAAFAEFAKAAAPAPRGPSGFH